MTHPGGGWSDVLRQLHQTWRDVRRDQGFFWLPCCATACQAGIAVVIALAAVYAEQVLVFPVNTASAVGAFSYGHWQDPIGQRPALAVTTVGWILMTALACAAMTATLFWFAALLAGLCVGRASRQAARWQSCLRWPHSVLSTSGCGRLPAACRPSSGG